MTNRWAIFIAGGTAHGTARYHCAIEALVIANPGQAGNSTFGKMLTFLNANCLKS